MDNKKKPINNSNNSKTIPPQQKNFLRKSQPSSLIKHSPPASTPSPAPTPSSTPSFAPSPSPAPITPSPVPSQSPVLTSERKSNSFPPPVSRSLNGSSKEIPTSSERSIQELCKTITTSSHDNIPKHMKQLQKHIQNLIQEKKDVQETLSTSNAKLNAMLIEKLARIADLEKEKNTILENAEGSMVKLDSILASRMDSILQLEQKNNDLQDQLAEYQKRYLEGSSTSIRSSSESTSSTYLQEKAKQETIELEKQLRNALLTCERLSQENKNLGDSLANEISLRKIAESYSRGNEEVINSHRLVVHNLELDHLDQKQQVSELKKVINSLNEQIAKDNVQKNSLDADLQQTRHQVTELNKTIAALKIQVDKEKFQVKSLAKSLQLSENTVIENNDVLEDLQIKFDEQFETLSQLQVSYHEIDMNNQNLQAVMVTLEHNAEMLQDDNQKLEAANLQLRKQIKELESRSPEHHSLPAQYSALEKSYQQNLSTITSLELENNELSMKVQKQASQVHLLTVSNEIAQKKETDLQKIIAAEKAKSIGLLTETQTWKKQNEDLKRKWEAEKKALLRESLQKELILKTKLAQKLEGWLEVVPYGRPK